MTGHPKSLRWLLAPRTVRGLILAPALLLACAQEPTGTIKSYAQQAAKPGAGVPVTTARANWTSGYFEAEVVAALLGELGYLWVPKLATSADLRLQAAHSYSLINPPRTDRRLIRCRSRRGAGCSGRGGRSWSARCGRRRL
jgi:hypothetical protein